MLINSRSLGALPAPNVIDVYHTNMNNTFNLGITLDADATKVTVIFDGQYQFPAEGSGTRWSFTKPLAQGGSRRVEVWAKNAEGATGKPWTGQLETVANPNMQAAVATSPAPSAPATSAPNVTDIRAASTSIKVGDTLNLNVTTDAPANAVKVVFDGQYTFDASGSGTSWSFSKPISAPGSRHITVTAMDAQGKTGSPMAVDITVSSTQAAQSVTPALPPPPPLITAPSNLPYAKGDAVYSTETNPATDTKSEYIPSTAGKLPANLSTPVEYKPIQDATTQVIGAVEVQAKANPWPWIIGAGLVGLALRGR